MAEIESYQQSNPTIQRLLHCLDPISLILSQNSSPHEPVPLRLTTESCYIMERGPRYGAYAKLRESRLRMKISNGTKQQQECLREDEEVERRELRQSPAKKQVKFSGNPGGTRKGSSVLAQSVPDFSATLRKENRKPPPSMLPSLMELTPPSKNWAKRNSNNNGVLSNLSMKGSKSASAGEKRGGGLVRKSYATMEDLKKVSMAATSAINCENKVRRSARTGVSSNKTVLGYRQF